MFGAPRSAARSLWRVKGRAAGGMAAGPGDRDRLRVRRQAPAGATREELLRRDKQVLVDQIMRLEAHNVQLKNIISKGLVSQNGEERAPKGRPFDFTKTHKRRVLLRILYLGWDWLGLATQEDTTKTIEHQLFRALTRTCLVESRETAGYHRCGRTDKGVSSFGQTISITLRSKFSPELQDSDEGLANELPYCKMLNNLLPAEIRTLCWKEIPRDAPDYSARFNCTKREYKYYFPRGNLNLTVMREACKYIVGSHDFRNLCKMDVGNGVTEFYRNVLACAILPVELDSEDATTMYCLCITGNAFLWHQIRCIMGLLLLIGQGLERPEIVSRLLDVQKSPRKPQYFMALDLPLNLFHCEYELDERWRWDAAELRSVVCHLQAEWTQYSVKSTMIRDCLRSLEGQYGSLCSGEGEVRSQAECLLQGVRSRQHKPLMERDTCSSLEEKIDHYTKKRRLEPAGAAADEVG